VAQLLKRDEEMKSLIHLNELLQSCTTQAEAYQVVALVAPELFAGESGCLAMLHPADQMMETVARWGDETALVPSFSLEDCWALRRGKLHEVSDPRVDLLCHHFVHDPQAGYLCVPLIVPSGTNGLLCLTGATGKEKGSSARQRLAVAAGEMIKLYFYSLRLKDELRDQAIHDPLTGLCNRRYLDESLSRELHRGRRGKSPLCVVMLDLDNFKQFNDAFGHDAGDSVLRQLGQMLRDKLRKSDISCRYGGDEFVLVLPDSSLADTEQRLEQIRALVKELRTQTGAPRRDMITISAGIASAPEHGSTAAELFQAADKAMYAAKHAGGNCVVVSQAKNQLGNS
jgi:diguanylate cyclase (GGDEF)-like protein